MRSILVFLLAASFPALVASLSAQCYATDSGDLVPANATCPEGMEVDTQDMPDNLVTADEYSYRTWGAKPRYAWRTTHVTARRLCVQRVQGRRLGE